MEAFEKRPAPPWARPHGLEAVLEAWRSDPKVATHLVLDHEAPAQPPKHAPLPGGLAPGLEAALRARGIHQLYSHQAEAYGRAVAGEDLVVATPTASGKSLCYHLPVLDTLAQAADARALYLFPTKALARDQEEGLCALMRAAGLAHGAVTYDGDTPGDVRRAARERSGILVTNPDMLHAGILPHHAAWARLFSQLRFVVIDEVHAYRGVFGSHLSNVLRRLERVAAFHGSRPQYLFSSATIQNPEAHASRLAGRPVGLVAESGAPAARRHILVYNPPLVNAELGMRRSYVKCAVDRTIDLLRAGVSTLVFGQSRNGVEVMLKYLRDRIPTSEIPPERIQAYRGGYLPETRRRIERGLRSGAVSCVVATNALELGIDIGALEAVVCAGYPGTMAALWQRFGRGGRRGQGSLALLVPSSSPLDQFLARHPQLLLEAPLEAARIDPDNVEILVQHLKCAAFELQFRLPAGDRPSKPYADPEVDGFGDLPAEGLRDALDFLEAHRVVRMVPSRGGGVTYHWSAEAHPASHVSLRSPSFDNFVIIDVAENRAIAEMDFRSTHTMLHEQAIYQHEGLQFQVERLDYENHKAFVRRVAPDYYTTAMTQVRVSVLEEEASGSLGFGGPFEVGVGLGEVDVVEKVVGFKKIKFHTHENVGYGEVDLPVVEKPSTAFWVTVPQALVAAADVPRPLVMDALRGWLTALESVAAVGLMMDPRDIGTAFVDEPGVGASTSGPLVETRALEGATGGPRASLASSSSPATSVPSSASSVSSSASSVSSSAPSVSSSAPSVSSSISSAAFSISSSASSASSSSSASSASSGRGALELAGTTESGASPSAFEPTLYLYDAVAGGIGLSARLFEERRALLERSARLVTSCGCEEGCPSCVGPATGTLEAFNRKAVLIRILSLLGLGRPEVEASR